jgi:hypothetical protein
LRVPKFTLCFFECSFLACLGLEPRTFRAESLQRRPQRRPSGQLIWAKKIHKLGDVSLIGQCLKYSEGRYEVSHKIYKFYQKRNFGVVETDSNVSLVSLETSIEKSEVSVEFSERNASVAKTRNFELLCM